VLDGVLGQVGFVNSEGVRAEITRTALLKPGRRRDWPAALVFA
jgi:hypothetical protein